MNILEKLFGSSAEEDPPSQGSATQEQLLNEEKQDMIQGIEDLSQTSVKEVMVPRIDVTFLSKDIPEQELLESIAETGYSRFPIYGESIDDVVGVLHVKDLIKALSRHDPIQVETVMRKPFFVPESKRIDSLLREFKRQHVHIAIAVDEYGGISGIVCLEDIIEEIVGEIQDEFDNERDDIVALEDGAWLCDARVNIDDFNDLLEVTLPDDEFDTLGGFVFDLFGKIPVQYEKATWEHLDFIVQDMDSHRINLVKVVKNIQSEEK